MMGKAGGKTGNKETAQCPKDCTNSHPQQVLWHNDLLRICRSHQPSNGAVKANSIAAAIIYKRKLGAQDASFPNLFPFSPYLLRSLAKLPVFFPICRYLRSSAPKVYSCAIFHISKFNFKD